MTVRPPFLTALTCLALASVPLQAQVSAPAQLPAQSRAPADAAEQVDAIFADWDSVETPGCAMGVAQNGLTVLANAWGMANLEWGIPNTERTIFENGSVSKQFTAAAVVLLSLEGQLSLDDDIRQYIPEVPDYGSTITITHLMNHTSGLRDWGSVAGISGWGRSNRTHNHDHVLDIVSRQTALNFEPGHEYSYSNTGYNLLAILVERISGTSFAQFSRTRVFEPVGMLDTQWRDDYTRLVPGRSTAYARRGENFVIDHPIENVHGNGGLLTTIPDLLRWNESLTNELFGAEFVRLMEQNGVLNDGRSISYARGLVNAETGGLRSITHTGATSGFRAYLGRFPDQGLSVAVLCNVGNVNPGGLGAQVADIYLGEMMVDAEPPSATATPTEEQLSRWTGMWVDEQMGLASDLSLRDGSLRIGTTALIPIAVSDQEAEFHRGTSGQRLLLRMADGEASGRIMEGDIEVDAVRRVEPVEPGALTAGQLAGFAGTYWSKDAETELVIAVEDGVLSMTRRPGQRMVLRPLYADAFTSPLGPIIFSRDSSGRVTSFGLVQGRVYDMRFERAR